MQTKGSGTRAKPKRDDRQTLSLLSPHS